MTYKDIPTKWREGIEIGTFSHYVIIVEKKGIYIVPVGMETM
jgi:bifunctional DNA-binding transcriptional regulator/antitoxin component of YhaV-PrlF toxin-antitoxin module